MDVATGYLEVDGLLALDGQWQKLDKIRIILGNEMTRRTKEVIDQVVKYLVDHLRESVDAEQDHNEFLIGVPAITEANVSTTLVEKTGLDDNKIFINKETYFKAPYELSSVWEYTIGGNQPLQKWLKDRKGQTLTPADIEHYKQMIAALQETQRIMQEIDEIIEL